MYKEKLVHFMEDAGDRLRLSSQATLHAIQLLNCLDSFQRLLLAKALVRNAQTLAIALLSLSAKLYETKQPHMRELVRVLRTQALCSAQTDEQSTGLVDFAIGEWEVRVTLWMQWKVSIPLLYDEVLSVIAAWGQQKEQHEQLDGQCLQNLLQNTRICLYNFDHLLTHCTLQGLSDRIRRTALGLFVVSLKFQRDKQRSSTPTAPRLARLNSFLRKNYRLKIDDLTQEAKDVINVLNSYKVFRDKSKGDKSKKGKDSQKTRETRQIKECKEGKQGRTPKQGKDKDKTVIKLKDPRGKKRESEDKENTIYFVNKVRSRSKKQDEPYSQKHKSRSRSKQGIRQKDLLAKKKSSSAKSIITGKNLSQGKNQVKNDCSKFRGSRISKRSEKSQLNSKINHPAQPEFTSKSSYWLRSGMLKTQKKSNNSSIRMKMR